MPTALIDDIGRLDEMWGRASRHLLPPDPLLTSEWAERNRFLTTDVSARPGKWRNENAPYLVEPMDVELLEPWVDTIIMQKASRLGGTETVNNRIGRYMELDPCPMLYVQQSHDEAQKYSDQIFEYFIENCVVVESLLTLNNTFLKKFPGGNLNINGAQTPKAFRMLEKRIVVVDDIDGFPHFVGEEGDPVTQAFKRCANNPRRLKIAISSPSIKGYSAIEKRMLQSDQRRWHVPCPLCEHEQTLKWGGPEYDFGVKWKDRDPSTAHYLCEACHKKIQHFQKYDINLRGRWIKTANPLTPNIAGYYFSQVFSNFVTWPEMVTEWLGVYQDPDTLQVFVNTSLGETYEDKSEQVSDDSMLTRREDYGPKVPVGAWVLTAWADLQHDRLEVQVSGWGFGTEHWLVEYKLLYGDPLKPELWENFFDYLTRLREHETGIPLRIMAVGIDSGYLADKVYEFVRLCKARKSSKKNVPSVFATKGANIMGKPIMAERASKNVWKDKKVHLYEIGTDTAKTSIYRRLLIQGPGPAYMHFYQSHPVGCQPLDEYYFAGLTNAKRINTSKNKLKPKLVWVKREKSGHDEQLDCMVGNLAVLNWLMQFEEFQLDAICERMERKAIERAQRENGIMTGKPKSRVRSKGLTIDDIMGRK